MTMLVRSPEPISGLSMEMSTWVWEDSVLWLWVQREEVSKCEFQD